MATLLAGWQSVPKLVSTVYPFDDVQCYQSQGYYASILQISPPSPERESKADLGLRVCSPKLNVIGAMGMMPTRGLKQNPLFLTLFFQEEG